MNQPSEEQKQAALEAGREGMKKAYERSRGMSDLSWWELPASCPAAAIP